MEIISPMNFKSINQKKSLEELYVIKQDIENKIKRYELKKDQPTFFSGVDTYETLLNVENEYLKIINELIDEKKYEIDNMFKNLIKSASKNDPFVESSLKKFFDGLDKTTDEKINFLKKISKEDVLFNKFTKEIRSLNSSEELFNKYINKCKNVLVCPNCGERLGFMMPDGQTLNCPKCNKYYINNNGSVGSETSNPYENDGVY